MTNTTPNTPVVPLIAQYFDTIKPNPITTRSYIKNLVNLQPVLAAPCGQHGNPSLIKQLLALPLDIRVSTLELDEILFIRHRHLINVIEGIKAELYRYGKVSKKIINVPKHVDSFGITIEAKEQIVYMLLPEQILHVFLALDKTEVTLATNFSIVRELFQI